MWTLSHGCYLPLEWNTHLQIHLFTYLWVQGNIQMWNNCRLKIAYCCGLWTWFLDQTPWTDVDQSLTIRTLLLTGRHWHGNSSSPAPLPPQSSALTGRILSVQSTKTNKAASDATIEARVVNCNVICMCWMARRHPVVRCHPVAYWSPTGRLFGTF